jgi:four helix bundle protein
MGDVRSFRDLDAWQLAMDAVEKTYTLTSSFPDEERFGLISQMRRAAVSVPSNVAEGQAVRAPKWNLRHLVTAIGSLAELDTQLEVARRLRFVAKDRALDLQQTIDRLRQLLYGLRREKERRIGLAIGGTATLLWLTLSRLLA